MYLFHQLHVINTCWKLVFFFLLCHPQLGPFCARQNHVRRDVMRSSNIKPLLHSQNEGAKPSVFTAYRIPLPRQQPRRHTAAAQYLLAWLHAIQSYTYIHLHYCGTLLALRLHCYRGAEPSELLGGPFQQTCNIRSRF